jgi:hypothetical protein
VEIPARQIRTFYEISLDQLFLNFKDFRTGYRFTIEFENIIESRLIFINLNLASFMIDSISVDNRRECGEKSLIDISSDL